MNLVGGFILSVIPLGLSALAFASSHPSVRFGLGAQQEDIDLRKYYPSQVNPRIFIGIDVSRSVLDEPEALSNLCEIIDSLMTAPVPDLQPVSSSQAVEVYQIGSSTILTDRLDGSSDSPRSAGQPKTTQALASKVCDDLKNHAVQKQSDQAKFTDIVTFLDAVKLSIKKSEEQDKTQQRPAATNFIVIASDFLNESPSGKPTAVEEEERISGMLADLANSLPPPNDKDPARHSGTRLYFLTFENKKYRANIERGAPKKEAAGSSEPKKVIVDVLPLLKWKFPDQWQEHPVSPELLRDAKVSLRMKGALTPLVLVPVDDPIYLTYEETLTASQESHPTRINGLKRSNSDSNLKEIIGLQLRAYPDRGSLPDEVQIRYRVNSDSGLARLALGRREPEWIPEAVRSQSSFIELLPASNYGQSRATHSFQLVILAPSQGVKYAIPVTILPLYPDWCQKAFRTIVAFFAFSVVILVAVELIFMIPTGFLRKVNYRRVVFLERTSGIINEYYKKKRLGLETG